MMDHRSDFRRNGSSPRPAGQQAGAAAFAGLEPVYLRGFGGFSFAARLSE